MTCGRSPPQASHRWRPGGFERFPGLLCLGVPLSLREWFSAWHGREIPHQKTWDRSVCRRWRQAAPRLRLKRRQKTKENLKSPTRPPAVKPRVSPESRAFQSPSTTASCQIHPVVRKTFRKATPNVSTWNSRRLRAWTKHSRTN